MMLQATSMGLMAHQMGGFDELKIRQEFSVPDGFEVMAVMAVGYPSSNEVQQERKRKPLGENFFSGSWGSTFECLAVSLFSQGLCRETLYSIDL